MSWTIEWEQISTNKKRNLDLKRFFCVLHWGHFALRCVCQQWQEIPPLGEVRVVVAVTLWERERAGGLHLPQSVDVTKFTARSAGAVRSKTWGTYISAKNFNFPLVNTVAPSWPEANCIPALDSAAYRHASNWSGLACSVTVGRRIVMMQNQLLCHRSGFSRWLLSQTFERLSGVQGLTALPWYNKDFTAPPTLTLGARTQNGFSVSLFENQHIF